MEKNTLRKTGIYDIAVIGAGPAGASAALSAAKSGRRVCLLERKKMVGIPVRCGEAMGLKGITNIGFEVDPSWILARISSVRMVSPNQTVVEYSKDAESYVVDRELMDAGLVQRAIGAGADYFPLCPVVSVIRTGEHQYECVCPDRVFQAACVIIADGIESRLARDLGWNTTLSLSDIDCCAFGRITHERVDPTTCIFYVGTKLTPAGYVWVFPRGNSQANVGLGVLGSHSSPGKARELLISFVNNYFDGVSIAGMHCGAAPAGRWVSPLVKDGAMLVGDAAGQINSLTGGGINYSIYAGSVAGSVAAEAFLGSRVDYRHLKKYHDTWAKGFGKQQRRSNTLKTLITKISSDAFLDRIAASLSRKDNKSLSILKVFLRTFASHPVALVKALLLFR